MKRTLAAAALVVIFTLALATPVFGIKHEAVYKWDGTVDFSQQAGHFCNTGAEMQQRISGTGEMSKEKTVTMSAGVITVSDNNSWVTAPNAIRNMQVTTAIKLCAPAKTVYEDGDWGYPYNSDWLEGQFYELLADNSVTTLQALLDALGVTQDQLAASLGVPVAALANLDYEEDKISDQIWAVMVSANPGYSGQVDMGFQAAYSNKVFPGTQSQLESWMEDAWTSARNDYHDWSWMRNPYSESYPGYQTQGMGPWFKGNYFAIEQFARTSNGTMRRYTDISSPWSHGYLSQDMTIVGFSQLHEAFTMSNLAAGDSVGELWWDLF